MSTTEQGRGRTVGTIAHRVAWSAALSAIVATGFVAEASAQLPGWSTQLPVTIVETSGADLSDYQVRLVLDTAALISGGVMNSDGSDLRFGMDATGSTLLDYWIESGVNTASTVVWIKVPSLLGSQATGIYLFTGNVAAPAASTLNVFGYDNPVDNSATNQLAFLNAGGVTNSQRGFRFVPNEDVLLIQFGKNEPNGSTRYITLFDNATQAILRQMQVSGPAAQYTYVDVPQPIWLTQGTQYLLEMYQGDSDGYYFGAGPQINPKLTYLDMRYCNGCTKDTFPLNFLNAIQYGYPDFEFMTRKHAGSEPTVVQEAGPTQTSLVSSGTPVVASPVTLTATVDGIFSPTGVVSFHDGAGIIAGCESVVLDAGSPPSAACTTSELSVGSHDITAIYSGDIDDQGSTSALLTQVVDPFASATLLGTACRLTFVENQPFTMSAMVSGLAPTGSVWFSDGANMLATVPLNAGSATFTYAGFSIPDGIPAETHALTANYSGDADNTASASTQLLVDVLNVDEVIFRNGFDPVTPACPVQ